MRFKLLLFIAITVIFLANKNGIMQPRAGAPVDGGNDCSQCHSGGSFDPEVDLIIKDESGNTIEKYKPNTLYTIEVVGTNKNMETPNGYGFQMVAMDTLENKQAGTFSELGSNVRSIKLSGRDYMTQQGARQDGTFSVKWTSPEETTGQLAFYVAMLAVNGNGNTLGDNVVTHVLKLDEDDTSSNLDISFKDASFLENTLVSDILRVKNINTIAIYSISGEIVYQSQNSSSEINLERLNSGIYFVKGDNHKALKIYKL